MTLPTVLEGGAVNIVELTNEETEIQTKSKLYATEVRFKLARSQLMLGAAALRKNLEPLKGLPRGPLTLMLTERAAKGADG